MIYQPTHQTTRRSRRIQQDSDSDVQSLEEGTSSDEHHVMLSHGKHRAKVKRGLHKVHKRFKEARDRNRKRAQQGKEIHLTRKQKGIAALVLLLVLAGAGVAIWKTGFYAEVVDFVTFPELKTPLDPASIFGAATSAVVSVATMIASGAVSVGQEATSALAEVTHVQEITKAAEITKVAEITKIGCVFGGCKRDREWDEPKPGQTAAPTPRPTAQPL